MRVKVAIIGAGSVGTAVGVLLARAGYEMAGVASRTPESAVRLAGRLGAPCCERPEDAARGADMVLITTSDQAIGTVAREVARAGGFGAGQAVMHFSGSLTSEVLEPAAQAGAITLSVHPLQSCPSGEAGIRNLPRAVYSIEGDPRGYELAEKLVRALGSASFFFIDKEAKPLYHAAACVASNYLVTLLRLSQDLLARAGMPVEMAFPALLPLIQGTLDNVASLGIPQALTGPIARGDVDTIQDHLAAMQVQAPELIPFYRLLARRTIDLAQEKGTLAPEKAARLWLLMGGREDLAGGAPGRREETAPRLPN
ncbi:MAG: DUF2520 domain-containing protein [Clostridia bacterium]|nr:MAG: DUF2520 domain-containing protein [Clostridia bacterium]